MKTFPTMSEDDILAKVYVVAKKEIGCEVRRQVDRLNHNIFKANEDKKDPRVKDVEKVYKDSMKLNKILMTILEDGKATINKDDFKLIQGGY
jgi:hypothetical protein